MPSFNNQIVFSDPAGRANSVIQFTAPLVFFGMYLYAWNGGNGDSSSWLLVMMVGSALSAIAESLSKEHQLTAGILRTIAVTVLLCLLATTLSAAEFVVG